MTYMKMLSAWAAYTGHANTEMTKILMTLPPGRFHEAAPTYFKSIAGLLDHGFQSSIFWAKRCSDGGLMPEWLPAQLAALPLAPKGEVNFTDLADYALKRRALDALFVGLCARGDDALFARTFTFLGRDKADKTMEFGGAILTALNHEVHHRGGVATILDGWSVENDWSTLMPFMLAN